MSRRAWLGRFSAAAAVSCLLFACGGDDDDGVEIPDGGGGSGGDAAAGCPVEGSLGSFEPLGTMAAQHLTQPADPPDPAVRALAVAGRVDTAPAGQPIDLLAIELWDGFGAFIDGQFAAGEYSLTGDEANLLSCGVCVHILGDATLSGGQVQREKEYIATAGTITVDSAGTRDGNEITGDFNGSITGMTLTEVDNMTGAPVAGGCTTSIATVTWSSPIENGDGGGGNPPPGGADAGATQTIESVVAQQSIAHRKVAGLRMGKVKPRH